MWLPTKCMSTYFRVVVGHKNPHHKGRCDQNLCETNQNTAIIYSRPNHRSIPLQRGIHWKLIILATHNNWPPGLVGLLFSVAAETKTYGAVELYDLRTSPKTSDHFKPSRLITTKKRTWWAIHCNCYTTMATRTLTNTDITLPDRCKTLAINRENIQISTKPKSLPNGNNTPKKFEYVVSSRNERASVPPTSLANQKKTN